MKLRADGFDVWVFRRAAAGIEYLLLRASQEKADRWFGGAPFWQVPSDFVGERTARRAVTDELSQLGLEARDVWAVEHCYSIFNNRYQDIVHVAVFAAEVGLDAELTLGDGHSAHAWLDGDAAAAAVEFRGLSDGLKWTRHFITDRDEPMAQLRVSEGIPSLERIVPDRRALRFRDHRAVRRLHYGWP